MKNYGKAFCISIFEAIALFSALYIGKNLHVRFDIITFQGIIFQIVSMLLVPIVCLIIFSKLNKKLFVIKEKKLLLCLAILYVLFFFIRKQFNILGIYAIIETLLVVAFTEEYIYRGLIFTILKRENRFVAIIFSGLIWGIAHSILPTVLNNGDIMFFLNDALSQIGFGIVIGFLFIYMFEKSGTLWIPIMVHALYDYSLGYGLFFLFAVVIYLRYKSKHEGVQD